MSNDVLSGVRPEDLALTDDFQTATDQLSYIKSLQDTYDLRQQEVMIADGVLTEQQVSLMVNNSRIKNSSDSNKAEEKRRNERMMTDILLDDMRERLAELEADMAERLKGLQEQYGEDVVGGMAEAFLEEDELAGLETDEQKLRALADKFLDENGNVKEEYAHLGEALYVRDWNEAEELKLDIAQYEGRNTLSATEHAKEKAAAETASLSDNASKIKNSTNEGFKETVDSTVDESRGEIKVSMPSVQVPF